MCGHRFLRLVMLRTRDPASRFAEAANIAPALTHQKTRFKRVVLYMCAV
jgi:hypothetical protein